jgi:bifunctional UDP-N-acetylglucosamine pyrophosphorylase/glucosamine-1-phosphate N-acetyltransferase
MRSELPKVLHPLLGTPLLEYALEKGTDLGADRTVVVVGHGREAIWARYGMPGRHQGREFDWAIQEDQRGTADAARVGIEALLARLRNNLSDDPTGARAVDPRSLEVLVLNGDLPLLSTATLERLVAAHRAGGADVTILTCEKVDPTGFGRLVRAPSSGGRGPGRITAIVEEADCDDATRQLREVNVGTYVFRAARFQEYFRRIRAQNAKGELYLTDVVVEAARDARVESVAVDDETETLQVNTQTDLARVGALLRKRVLDELLDSGVRIDDPSTTYIERGVKVAPGAWIHPFCVIHRGVEIGPGCEVGPFAFLRPGSELRESAKVGAFCEIKNSVLGERTKANHLSYLGDGRVGRDVNIGAGTIFANFDGKEKHTTVVKDRAFLGSGTTLVAPVTVGEGAVTGAGTVVLRGRDVGDGDVVVGVPARRLERRQPTKE